MWRSLIATDIDNDGDMDLVAGNLGLNCEYQVKPGQNQCNYMQQILMVMEALILFFSII